jgi:class 3 adenylate cyclase/tetratricopeptide (TPR) repeat protein
MAEGTVAGDPLAPYVPRLAISWLRDTPERLWREIDGSLAFVDISGFTQLTERLARKGKVGAEEMSDILNATFADLLSVAYADGAGLVKWGGDAVLLLFEGDDHAARAARAGLRMGARLDKIGKVNTGSGRVTLRMSIGIHSGTFHFFLVGDPDIHRELIISGPAASRTAEMEAIADAGEIALSPEAAALIDPALLGEAKGEAILLAAEPTLPHDSLVERPSAAGLDLGSLLPPPIRTHLRSAAGHPEHRRIAVAFVQFSGTDALLAEEGPDVLAAGLDEAVRNVQDATARNGVTFFESDINKDGGKIMLTAGAPSSAGHDEERMLRATRTIVERIGVVPLRVGVNCGPVFSGDFGPAFRKTYSVKGDAINLAARVMGKAAQGQLLATTVTLDASDTKFDVEPLAPFMVKGKSQPVHAASVGRRLDVRAAAADSGALVGREVELAALEGALADAAAGQGRLVDLVGEPGIGKSRLVRELLHRTQVRAIVTSCDEYETATAFYPFRGLLRTVIGVPAEAPDDVVAEALRSAADQAAPDLLPWLPLLAQVLNIEVEGTPEVLALAPEFRADRLVDVTAAFLQAALADPVVLVVDDVHLMDMASVGLLSRLAIDLRAHPWLLLVTRREVDGGFRPEGDDVVVLRPAPLGAAAAAALVAGELGDVGLTPHELEALTARAGGNPLFLRGLVLAARTGARVDQLPATVEALITSQIDRLPPDERTLLRFASVLGVGFHESELRALMHGHPLPTGRDALTRLGYFIRAEGHARYRFDHQLIRDTAYEGLPYRLRRDLHGRAGEAIEAAADDPDDVAELLSLHYLHAARPEKAWHYSRIGAARAAGKAAFVAAEELYERAVVAAKSMRGLPDVELADVLVALGEAHARTGHGQDAVQSYRAARLRLRDQPVRSALVLKDEASLHSHLGRHSLALRTATRGLGLLEGKRDRAALAARSRLEVVYSGVRLQQGKYGETLRWARQAHADATRSRDTEALAEALEVLQLAHTYLGVEPAEPYGARAVELYEQVGDRVRESRALNNLALESWGRGRGPEALEMFQRAERLAAEAGDTTGAAETRYNVGDVLLRLGRVSEAEELLGALLPVLKSLRQEAFYAAAMRSYGMTLAFAGSDDDGLALLATARARLDDLGEAAEVLETDAATALALLLRGDPGAAVDLATAAAARADALDAGHLLPWLLRLQGAGLADLGLLDEANAVLERALGLADSQSRVELGFVLDELVRVAEARGDEVVAGRYRAEREAAFDLLGFVGDRRYRHG